MGVDSFFSLIFSYFCRFVAAWGSESSAQGRDKGERERRQRFEQQIDWAGKELTASNSRWGEAARMQVESTAP